MSRRPPAFLAVVAGAILALGVLGVAIHQPDQPLVSEQARSAPGQPDQSTATTAGTATPTTANQGPTATPPVAEPTAPPTTASVPPGTGGAGVPGTAAPGAGVGAASATPAPATGGGAAGVQPGGAAAPTGPGPLPAVSPSNEVTGHSSLAFTGARHPVRLAFAFLLAGLVLAGLRLRVAQNSDRRWRV